MKKDRREIRNVHVDTSQYDDRLRICRDDARRFNDVILTRVKK